MFHPHTATMSLVSVVGFNLPVAGEMEVLGVVLDRRLTFESRVTAVARVCNYQAKAIHHIWHLLAACLHD